MRSSPIVRTSDPCVVMELCEPRRVLANSYDFITVVVTEATGQAAAAVPLGTHTLDDLGLSVAKPFFPDTSEFHGMDDLFSDDHLKNLVDQVNASTDQAQLTIITGEELPGVDVNVPSLGVDLAFHFSNATDRTVDFSLDVAPGFGTVGGQLQFTGDTSGLGDGAAGVVDRVLVVNGTSAADTLTLTPTSTGVQVNLNGAVTAFASADYDSISVTGGDGADHISAGGVGTKMFVDAGAANDYVLAGRKNDTVLGGGGNDTLSGGAGKNQIDGGDGDDRLNGSNGPDNLKGGAGKDRLYGQGGDDRLDGGGGPDRLFGAAGNDFLIGGGSNDRLLGEAGDDTLVGNAGHDFLNGGSDNDQAADDADDTRLNIEVLT